MFFAVCIVLILIQTQFEAYLHRRQYMKIIGSTEAPEIFKEFYTQDEFSAAREYEMEKSFFKIIQTLYLGFVLVIFVMIIAKIWKILSICNEYIRSIIFVIILAILFLGFQIPMKYYNTFVIEQKHGFNNSTLGLFIRDQVTVLGIVIVEFVILVPIFMFIYKKTGKAFIPIGCLIYVLIIIIHQLIFPTIIYPLFTKLTPLEKGELFDAVMKLANETDFPVSEMYSADDSKRSNHQNAMLFGLWTKKVAIADTLLNVSTPETIQAIVGHEIGHSKHHHIIKMMFIGFFEGIILFTLLNFIMKSDKVFQDFGLKDEKPFIVGFIIFFFLYTPISTLLQLPENMCIRYFEFQADHYSASRGLPLDVALLKLAKDNKMAIEPDYLFHSLYHSHPTILQRVDRIRKIFAELKKE
ncbi:Clan MA, family M48, Ste24 endopeptidase-like metallopeptidase [Trichomonas vaginalis G3]|uniref:CAAX prenyl protease n=1 Tax=Trichomonas vaginalis (strain ATCC PRA-98 / G3) TaxID=412133 RepID=A2E2V6_TRIV3|nr:CAAX-box protein processing protein family [Trichomonas vaginalis G3]EAY13011.1 Clan MA, family M48, Ste24 endopeptidase-like metallopeptidase [Trichomonas vaginalis G3]KAI5503100.1 CAAX-box protein processing protein family [Trichomonas vaginalis G3]|eukprot:XP_001325234.1 Clan MA, family M48, Ste24 endopeptidase-like metallopeptidase [Trichomonas vaginalis G3]